MQYKLSEAYLKILFLPPSSELGRNELHGSFGQKKRNWIHMHCVRILTETKPCHLMCRDLSVEYLGHLIVMKKLQFLTQAQSFQAGWILNRAMDLFLMSIIQQNIIKGFHLPVALLVSNLIQRMKIRFVLLGLNYLKVFF